jgi:hypothetical protein
MNIHDKITGIIAYLKSFEFTYEKIYDLINDLKSSGFTNEAKALDGNLYGATGSEVLLDLYHSFRCVLLPNVNIKGDLRKKIKKIWMSLRIKLFLSGWW